MMDGRSRTTPLPVEGESSALADACNGDGESGLDCIPTEAEVIGAKADAALIMTAAATLSTFSDRTIL